MSKIKQLQAELHLRYPPLTDYLLPGIDPAMLRQKFDALGVHPSAALYEFYAWTRWVDFDLMYANGVALEYSLFKGYYPTPFDTNDLEANITDTHGERYWTFMQNDFGCFFVEKMSAQPAFDVQLDNMPEGYDPNYPDEFDGFNDLEGAFESLDKFIETIITGLQKGALFYTTENGVDEMESSEAMSAIGKQINPNMPYWNE